MEKLPRAFVFYKHIHSCSNVGKDMCQRVTYLLLQTVLIALYPVTAGKMVFKEGLI